MTSPDPGSATGAHHRHGVARLLGVGALGVVVLLAASGVLLLRVAEAIVPRTEVEAIEARDHGDAADDGSDVEPVTDVQDILVVGIDSRKGLTEEEIDAISAGHFDSELTDTVMWVQFDPQQGQLRMVSFPRDLRVHPDGGPAVKLNSLHYYGGPDLLVSTVEQIVGADLDHYVQVDLAGFLHLAETLDGVEVCIEEPMVDPKSGLDLPAGCQDLDAEQATGFVRARQVSDRFGAGTAGRAARQQYFIRQAISEVVTAGTLANPSRVRAMIDLARQSVVVDEGFGTRELVRLGNAFRTFDGADQVVGATVPFTSQRYEDGLFYDELADGAEELFAALRDGEALPADLVTTGEPDTSVSIADGGLDTTAQ